MQPTLHPPGAVHHHVDATHHAAPQREDALVGRLRIDGVRRAHVAAAIRQVVAAGQLAADHGGANVLGRAECRSTRLHVDVRGEAPVHHGRSRTNDLTEGDAGEGFSVLLGEGPGERDRCHCPGERERGHHNGLISRGHLDDPMQHRSVEPQRRVGVDDREDRRLAVDGGVVDASGDAHHLDAVPVLLAAQAVAVDVLVGQRQHVEGGMDVAYRGMDVDRFDRVAGDEVDRVEHLSQLQEVIEPGPVTDVAHPIETDDVRRAGDRPVGHPGAADVQVLVRIPAVQSELGGRGGDPFEDQLLGKADVLAGLIDIGAGIAEQAARLPVPDVHADSFEDRQRGGVDRFQLVCRHHLGVVETHARLLPRTLQGERAARTGVATTSPSASVFGHRPKVSQPSHS